MACGIDTEDLDRAHLLARELGGCACPANLVLLCARCHAEAPDIGDPDLMLRWCQERENWLALISPKVERLLEAFSAAEMQVMSATWTTFWPAVQAELDASATRGFRTPVVTYEACMRRVLARVV